MRAEAERVEHDFADKGKVAAESVKRAAELDQREVDMAAREAELQPSRVGFRTDRARRGEGPRARAQEQKR